MRSLLRHIGLCMGTALCTVAMAQQPYSIWLTGTVAPCDSNTFVNIQTVQGTLPALNIDIPVGPMCTYAIQIDVASNPAWIMVSTSCGFGSMATNSGSAIFNSIGDTAIMVLDLNCGGGVDCMGVLNGPDMPGTPCDDGDPMTGGDTWTANCNCVGTPMGGCQAAFTVQQTTPWVISTTNLSTGQPPLTYDWWMPDGTSSTQFEPNHTFGSEGVYGICLTITDNMGCSSWHCDTLAIDSLGFLSNSPIIYDCLGVLWGPAMPGTPCDDGDPNTMNDTWTANCNCVGTGGAVDCLGVPNGTALPGTPCTIPGTFLTGIWSNNCVCDTLNNAFDCLGVLNGPNVPGSPCDDGDTLTIMDTWTASCNCVGVPANYYDCLNVLNGPALPGTPCDDGDPMTGPDMWTANCDCVGGMNTPCEADFWVLQAFDTDSMFGTPTPIPNLLWVWNLSSGGSGNYAFSWDFGDGSTSSDPFPTHSYANGGPYLLCLTIDDGLGCVDTYCDSIAIDANGLYTGLVLEGGDRASGFNINVLDPLSTSINEQISLNGLATWPNPVTDMLNVAFASSMEGTVRMEVIDMNGRVVLTQGSRLNNGRNVERISMESLVSGMYLLRITNGVESIGQRFVRSK